MNVVPFDQAAHDHLITAGYTWKRVACSYEDIGDAENGPELVGHPAFDEYTDVDSTVVIDEGGDTGFEWRDLEMEKHFATMYPDEE